MEALIPWLILLAGAVTIAAAMTTLTGARTSIASLDGGAGMAGHVLSLVVLCPPRQRMARVGVGPDREGRESELTVVQCEHYPEGPVACDRACVGASVAA